MIHPTPDEHLLDRMGRPVFLWDCDLTDTEFRALLRDPDPDVRAVSIAKLMRQAKPDDVFRYVTEREVRAHWGALAPHLGQRRAFWAWLLDAWEKLDE